MLYISDTSIACITNIWAELEKFYLIMCHTHPCQIHSEIQGLMEPDTQGKMGILLDVLRPWGPR